MSGIAIAADSDVARAHAEVVARFFAQGLAAGQAEAALAFLAEDFLDHDPAQPGAGRDGVVGKLTALWAAFPDGRFELQEIVAAGDRVFARSLFTGTQSGNFGALAPTGRRVCVSFSDLYRLRDGRIAEHWHDYDEAGLLRQLGVLPG